MAINTGVNSSPAPKRSKPSYHGGKPGKLNVPQKNRKAPHDSATHGSKTGKG